ncbi:MAG: oligosaccharide flippase family protein, partial [Aquificae bacterium]|nr:oligosaccharide flippase family protein [Aquificota bacterium]
MNIKERALKGIRWTALATIVGAASQILKISILTRFLSPTDFGLMALASVVTGFLQVFADGGVSNAIIYKQNITKRQLSILYWFNILIGIVLFLFLVLLAPIASIFYKEEELKIIIPLIGISILLQSFSFQYKAILEKELLFNT